MVPVMSFAQIKDPVHFTSQLKQLNDGEAELLFSATVDPGWHVYSTGLGNDGPISASFHIVKMEGAETVGKLQARGQEIKQYDKLFDMELRWFEKAVIFAQKIRFTKADYDIDCYLEYGACNDVSCLPPSEVSLKEKGSVQLPPSEKSSDPSESKPSEPALLVQSDTIPQDSVSEVQSTMTDLWQPVIKELQAYNGDTRPMEGMSWWPKVVPSRLE